MNQSLQTLVENGRISPQSALQYSEDKKEFHTP